MVQHTADTIDDRKTKAQAFFVPAMLKPTELLEDMGQLILGYARTGVPDLYPDIAFEATASQ